MLYFFCNRRICAAYGEMTSMFSGFVKLFVVRSFFIILMVIFVFLMLYRLFLLGVCDLGVEIFMKVIGTFGDG